MNKTLFLTNMKIHRTLFIIINLVLLMYSSIMIYMFDPEGANAMIEMINMLPKSFGTAFGFDTVALTLTTHIGSYLYGFIFIIFPVIFMIIMINSLIAKHVDRGSMVYLLSTPNSRKEIARTQFASYVMMLVALFIIQTGLGVLMAEAMHKGMLEVGPYVQINLITLFVFLFVGSIGFLASCSFDDSGRSLSVGAGIPVMFLLLKMLSGVGEKVEFLQYFTPYTLMNMGNIMNKDNFTLLSCLALLIASVITVSVAIQIFDKRSLNI